MRTLGNHYLNNFPLCHTTVLTIACCTVSIVLTYLITRILPLLATFLQFFLPMSSTSGNYKSDPFFSEFVFALVLDSTYKLGHRVFVFLFLTYFTQHNAFKVHPCWCKCGKISSFLWLNTIPLYRYTTTSLSIHPLMDTQIVSMFWLLYIMLL